MMNTSQRGANNGKDIWKSKREKNMQNGVYSRIKMQTFF